MGQQQARANRAILVLEKPWHMDGHDANRSSVLPFVQGVARYAGNIDVCHANFYNEDSFVHALDSLCRTPYANVVVYVAAHGDVATAGCHLTDLFSAVRTRSEKFNINGVLLGSCLAGLATEAHELALQGSALRWCIGYASECDWMVGTMIDCALLQESMGFNARSYGRANLTKRFGQAIAAFSPNLYIGDDIDGNPMKLSDSLQFVVQEPGKGRRAETISPAVFAESARFQLP